jgi:hypothetical protein
MLTVEILKANYWPDSYANSVERVPYLLERHDGIELLRIIAGVFEARCLQFAARSPGLSRAAERARTLATSKEVRWPKCSSTRLRPKRQRS